MGLVGTWQIGSAESKVYETGGFQFHEVVTLFPFLLAVHFIEQIYPSLPPSKGLLSDKE